MKPEVTSGKAEVATDCAKHLNVKPEVTFKKAVVRSFEKLNWMHRLSCPTIYHGIVFIKPVTPQADVGANNHSVGMNDQL
ncbi:MAG: hypothetical protein V7K21_18855 [Nostoc sp.]|uniref:hypothetical protein n=1 Tax=Nostoc sp. TaxID=1180 RepID=UPI002FF6B23E